MENKVFYNNTHDLEHAVSKVDPRAKRVNPLTAKLFNLNFHSLEVVSR